MYTFKEIDNNSTIIESNVINYTHNLTTSSRGIQSINIISASLSSSYWDSINVLYYTSGSPVYENQFVDKNKSRKATARGIQYLTKFHGYPSSSIITIPSEYYGEKIKEQSFTLTDKSFTDNGGNNPIIKDDGKGNLYSTNAHYSQSSETSISSSDNYVGNIFYEDGIAILTETASWSGSVNYSDITNDTNFTLEFDSFNTITTHEYSVTLRPHEFNKSMNYTLRMPLSGTFTNLTELTSSIIANPYLASEFTGSEFTPYITRINLYNRGDDDTPVIVAKLPKAVRKSNKISTTFKIRIDL